MDDEFIRWKWQNVLRYFLPDLLVQVLANLRIISFDCLLTHLQAVDVAAVVNCVRRYVWNRRPAISAYGQLQDFPDEQELPKYLMPSVNESKQKSNISL
jgi:hypothetical protein